MNKLRKELYDCFYNPPEFPAQKQEIEECHQALIHAPDQFLDLVLDYFLVQLHDFIKYGLLSPFRMVCRDFILPEPASYVFFYLFAQVIVHYQGNFLFAKIAHQN